PAGGGAGWLVEGGRVVVGDPAGCPAGTWCGATGCAAVLVPPEARPTASAAPAPRTPTLATTVTSQVLRVIRRIRSARRERRQRAWRNCDHSSIPGLPDQPPLGWPAGAA